MHHRLHKSTTHIITSLPLPRLLTLLELSEPPSSIEILLPTWISDSIRAQTLQSTKAYHLTISSDSITRMLPTTRPRSPSPPQQSKRQKIDVVSSPARDAGPLSPLFTPFSDGENEDDSDREEDWLHLPTPSLSPRNSLTIHPQWKIPVQSLACQKKILPLSPETPPASSVHDTIIQHLAQLESIEKSQGEQWRALAYRKAIGAIKRHPHPITSAADARRIRGIGDKIACKIEEIMETGTLRRLQHTDKRTEAVQLLSMVWGAGPESVKRWMAQGVFGIEDLKARPELLNKAQAIGVRYYREFQMRIPRDEVRHLSENVASAIHTLHSGITLEVCGSYRRGAADCGDIDILLTHPDATIGATLLQSAVQRLHDRGVLTDDLSTGSPSKYMGVCCLPPPAGSGIHRRIDIQFIPSTQWPLALLYFTGSAHFNRSMRLWARRNGYALCEKSLAKRHLIAKGKGPSGSRDRDEDIKSEPIPLSSEKEIFQVLGLEYIAPTERNI